MRFREWMGHRKLRAFRAPIYIHWTVFAIALVLLLISLDSVAQAVAAIVSYPAIILIHEFGHAWMARRRRYRVIAIRVAAFHGRCEYEAAEYEMDDVAIAWGGVLAQFAVAIPMLVLVNVTTPRMLGPFGPAVHMLGGVNLLIALFNLVPAPGLDGKKAWRVIPLALNWWRSRQDTKRMLRRWTKR